MKNHCKTIQCQGSDIASYLGQFNTDDSIQYTNGLLKISTPNGDVTIPPNTIVVIGPSTGGGTTGGNGFISYQGCQSLISIPVPAGSTQAQIDAIAQQVMALAAAQYAACNPPINPHHPPDTPIFLNPEIIIVTDCTADMPLSVSVALFPGLTVSGNNFVLAAGLFSSTVSIEDATNIAASFAQSYVNNLFATGGASCCAGLLCKLAVYYKFDEFSGTRYDVNGANPLSEVNGVEPSAAGKIGLAVNFAHQSSALTPALKSALTATPLYFSGSFSLSFWLKQDTGNNSFIGATVSSGGNLQWGITLNSISGNFNGVLFFANNVGFSSANYSNYDTDWHHIVCVLDLTAQTISLYIDNVLVDSEAATGPLMTPNPDDFVFMQWDVGSGDGTVCALDEFGAWNRVLKPAEIAQLYNGGAGLTYPFP